MANFYSDTVLLRYLNLIIDSTKTNLNILTNNLAEGSINIDTLLKFKDLNYVPPFYIENLMVKK